MSTARIDTFNRTILEVVLLLMNLLNLDKNFAYQLVVLAFQADRYKHYPRVGFHIDLRVRGLGFGG